MTVSLCDSKTLIDKSLHLIYHEYYANRLCKVLQNISTGSGYPIQYIGCRTQAKNASNCSVSLQAPVAPQKETRSDMVLILSSQWYFPGAGVLN